MKMYMTHLMYHKRHLPSILVLAVEWKKIINLFDIKTLSQDKLQRIKTKYLVP